MRAGKQGVHAVEMLRIPTPPLAVLPTLVRDKAAQIFPAQGVLHSAHAACWLRHPAWKAALHQVRYSIGGPKWLVLLQRLLAVLESIDQETHVQELAATCLLKLRSSASDKQKVASHQIVPVAWPLEPVIISAMCTACLRVAKWRKNLRKAHCPGIATTSPEVAAQIASVITQLSLTENVQP